MSLADQLDALDEEDARNGANSNTNAQYALDAYPDTDAQYGEGEAYPDTDAAYPDTDAAYPDTDAAYPDTDAQFAEDDHFVEGGLEEKEEAAYPDTDAQYTYAEVEPASRVAVAAPSQPPAHRRWQPPAWAKRPLMHRPRLEAWEKGVMKRKLSLGNSRSYVLGRNGQVADIIVEDSSISRAHAVLINSSTATFLQDLGSAHGTYLDTEGRTIAVPKLGVLLEASSGPQKLTEGATFRLGSHPTVYRVIGTQQEKIERWQPPAWAEKPSVDCHIEMRTNSFSNPYLSHFTAEDGGDVDEVISLSTPCTLFGRFTQVVDVLVRHESISRQHAVVLHADRSSYLLDLGSASGTCIDGVRIPRDQTVCLKHGQVITFGECKATYTFCAPPKASAEGGKRKR